MFAESLRLFGGEHAEPPSRRLHLRRIDARAVVGDADFDLAAVYLGNRDVNGAIRRFVFLRARRRFLDAVVDAISEQVDERIFHRFQNPPVDFDPGSIDRQFHLLILIAGELADEAREYLGQRGKRQHMHFLHIVKETVHHPRQRALIALGEFSQPCQAVLDVFQVEVFRIQIFEQLGQRLLFFGGTVALAGASEGAFRRAHGGPDLGSFFFPCRERGAALAQVLNTLARRQARRQQLFRLPHHRVELHGGYPNRFRYQAWGHRRGSRASHRGGFVRRHQRRGRSGFRW